MRVATVMRRWVPALVVLAVTASSAAARPMPGTFDQSFARQGRLVFGLPGEHFSPTAMAIQPDGRIVVAGTLGQETTYGISVGGRVVVLRFLPEGALDPSFGDGGVARASFARPVSVYTVALQPDGRLLLAGGIEPEPGRLSPAVIRLLPNGEVDEGFGASGLTTVDLVVAGRSVQRAYFSELALQGDGRIVAAGDYDTGDVHDYTDNLVARFLADGAPDTSFNGTGTGLYRGDEIADIVVHPAGQVIVTGSRYAGYDVSSALFAVRFSTDAAVLPPDASSDEVLWPFRGSITPVAAGLRRDGSIVFAAEQVRSSMGRHRLTWLRFGADLDVVDAGTTTTQGMQAAAFDSRQAILTVGRGPTLSSASPFGVQRFRGPRFRHDLSFGRRRGTSFVGMRDPAAVIGAEVQGNKLLIAGSSRPAPGLDGVLTLIRLHAHQDTARPRIRVHGLPTRGCVSGTRGVLVRTRDESRVRVSVRIDGALLRTGRNHRLPFQLPAADLKPGPHRLVVRARDAANNRARTTIVVRTCLPGVS